MTEWHFYEPEQGHGLRHDPLNAIVAPRPIGWISTVSRAGVRNLAPYSFFNLFNYRPPIVGFCSVGAKDSLANARETGEFVWNLAIRDLAEAMNATSAATSPETDEFALAGLETLPSAKVRPPRVAASPVQFECVVTQVVQLESRAGDQLPSWLVLGEAVAVHLDRALLDDGVYQTARARPITRGGGPADYFEITPEQLFRLERPKG
ncbi:flavin reductase family protein [Sphingomonas sp. BK580]|uniref:flavin reductase family protein n=1 Tax=Sphingomonas sp. BK580 TaxID=2586972 RepID=UPI00160C911F|nr:flavin reductase family protein [Sphingomonas sp. BK580]MBB3695110.1 flavin reductase (DIM6/NTAB) family NADH-FMN oxidoreductase RutF [Sphingomonas sp. BK580]